MLLVDQPIRALREALGGAVAVVGACHPNVASRADFEIDDPYPGIGPIGGVLASLEHASRDVFVLAGDLPAIDAVTVRTIIKHAANCPDAWAVIARTDRLHPTIGLYRPGCTNLLRQQIAAGRLALRHAIPHAHRLEVAIEPGAAANVNRPEDV
jgi:molybdopterin-guanine dinucleotide biosynthesis protein A